MKKRMFEKEILKKAIVGDIVSGILFAVTLIIPNLIESRIITSILAAIIFVIAFLGFMLSITITLFLLFNRYLYLKLLKNFISYEYKKIDLNNISDIPEFMKIISKKDTIYAKFDEDDVLHLMIENINGETSEITTTNYGWLYQKISF